MKVFVADDISSLGLDRLKQYQEIEIEKRTGLKEDELIAAVSDAEALLVRSQTKVTRKVIQACGQLKVIGRAGVGVDNIDVDAATEHGIVVINAPDGNTISAAEHTFAMLISLSRHIPQARQTMQEGKWDRKTFVGVELSGKTLAVVGMGRIGTEVAKRAKAFGMRLVAYDPFLTEDRAKTLGVTLKSLEDAVAEADFVTVHTPLTKDTKHIIDEKMFGKMKTGVRIVNCARGGIIDEVALCEALTSGKVAGAAFDVFEEEPVTADHPLLQFPQVITTPHLGASTVEAQVNVAVSVAEEVGHVLVGKPFKNAVNIPSLSEEQKQYLQPHLNLGERLGKFVGQLASGAMSEVEMVFCGELDDSDLPFVSRSVLKGLLGYRYGDEVNFINAPTLAKQAGMTIRQVRESQHKVFTHLLSLSVRVNGELHKVAGTLYNGLGPRIVEIEGYPIDASTEGKMIFTKHHDRPGMIGHLGSMLGKEQINIAAMQVGRKETGGEAVMLLTVDKLVPESVVHELSQLPGIHEVQTIVL
ncbi:phosphoglycerate dehydrogenase [Alicyclobacillus sp. SO9]|uniref:phosphoglycerate dehydrogenase n=1 Tax=Alicyclobacillus sp. SO9 TaxID=2665646 RepID=UPI0018E8E27D|nr:phosphoglycerate dehydrogenase [Alicyclobacillus sp. SO9]QQE80674.1 phosphoglycerate dehydrogenase [Alicyclobacillus sp. SO9]